MFRGECAKPYTMQSPELNVQLRRTDPESERRHANRRGPSLFDTGITGNVFRLKSEPKKTKG